MSRPFYILHNNCETDSYYCSDYVIAAQSEFEMKEWVEAFKVRERDYVLVLGACVYNMSSLCQ